MKPSYAFVALSALSAPTWALPRSVKRDDTPAQPVTPLVDDTAILNYALSLENLQSSFYTEALAKFDDQAFTQAGYPSSTRARYVMIGQHEQVYAAAINATLGENATQPCNYTFPYTDVSSFVNFSQLLEGVATSAYIGALPNITNSSYLAVAGSILATQARQSAWISSAVNNGSAWGGPFDTPLTPRQVLTLAAPFVSSCPSTNVAQPFAPFPSLTVSPGLPGSVVTFTFNATGTPSAGTNSTSGGDGSSTNGTTSDPNTPPTGSGPSGNGNTTDPNTTPDGSGSNPDGTNPSGTEPPSSDPSMTVPSGSGASASDSSDPSDPTNPPNLTIRQDSNTTTPGAGSPSNGTDGTNGTSPDGTTPSTNGSLFAAFLSGFDAQFAPLGSDGNVTLPSNLTGQAYAFVTTSDTIITDDTIVAGPAVLFFNSSSQGNTTSETQ
ncbi:ferritin-like domain-containing protein [Collybia nuda]|uniref:Ferritin-like domain-containing protein n=1 Tax=Collybia nuda TaxID=64659 RepID=A0A9P5XVD0_9AGAR|nr:ferritin-like domain-containing protein [Collybia nuda]